MIREKGGNAMWKSLSDDCPGDPRRRVGRPPTVRLDGFTRDVCLICGCWRNWPYGLVKHWTGEHIIWHIKVRTDAIHNGNRHVLTSLLVDGKAQPA